MHNFPVEPTANTLSFYTTYMCRQIEPRSVDSYLSGICSELETWFPDVRAARKSPLVARTLKGCKRMYSKPIVRKCTLTKHDLALAATHVGAQPSYDDKLFLAILFIGFHALLRLGELVWPDQRDLRSYRKLTMRNSVTVHDNDYQFVLPTHKADPFFDGSRVVVQRTQTLPDPHTAFVVFLDERDHAFPLQAELWLRADGSVPLRAWFMTRLRRIFPRDVAGHSMRAGELHHSLPPACRPPPS
ncbi:hypothetical protein OH77DRAFT_1574357, partial [Trametes cingulata]